MRIQKSQMKDPDLVEVTLIGILAIWTLSTFYLLWQASTLPEINLISWASLTAFFSGFGTITLLAIAVILEDIRKVLR